MPKVKTFYQEVVDSTQLPGQFQRSRNSVRALSNSLGEGVTNWDVYRGLAGKTEKTTWSNGGLPVPSQGSSPCSIHAGVAETTSKKKEGPVLLKPNF